MKSTWMIILPGMCLMKMNLLQYLYDAKNLSIPDDDIKWYLKKAMIRTAKSLLSRFFQTYAEEDIEVV